MKSNRKELSNRMKEHEKRDELWINMGTGKTCEVGAPLPGARVLASFSASSNFCSNSNYGVVT